MTRPSPVVVVADLARLEGDMEDEIVRNDSVWTEYGVAPGLIGALCQLATQSPWPSNLVPTELLFLFFVNTSMFMLRLA
jgi:hypothetical protein